MLLRGIGFVLPVVPTENVSADHAPAAVGLFSQIVSRTAWTHFWLKLIRNW
jgi:hypothetical protein